MDTKDIIIFTVVFAFLAFRLYQKYGKKQKGSSTTDTKTSSGTAFSSTSKDDDYEPYAKK